MIRWLTVLAVLLFLFNVRGVVARLDGGIRGLVLRLRGQHHPIPARPLDVIAVEHTPEILHGVGRLASPLRANVDALGQVRIVDVADLETAMTCTILGFASL